MSKTIRIVLYYSALPILLSIKASSYFVDLSLWAHKVFRSLFKAVAKLNDKKTKGAFKMLYVISVWVTLYLCYLKYLNVAFIAPYSYLKILLPDLIIAVIFLIESYFLMLKSAVNGKTGRDS